MPIPFILGAIAVATAATGVGKGIHSVVQNNDAKKTNESAQRIFNDAREELEVARENSKFALECLGQKKLEVFDKSINRFVAVFEKIHGIELDESVEIRELSRFRIDRQAISNMKEMGKLASSMIGGIATGGLAGGLAAFGAYSAAMTFGAASTGTAIASLSGAAATNATLAFLGGGSLAAGGFGIAGGTAILGGIVAGPALAVLGIFMDAKAGKNKDNAYGNLAEARKYQEEYRTAALLCTGISDRANMFNKLLTELDDIFRQSIVSLETIVSISGDDYATYNDYGKNMVAVSMSLAGAVKAVLDTPILTEEGGITSESEKTEMDILSLLDALEQQAATT